MLLPPGTRFHYYTRFFEIDEKPVHGYLTCTLGRDAAKDRDAILIDHHLDPVPPALRGPFKAYASALDAVKAGGVVGAAKRFIGKELKGLDPDLAQHVRVAVHKFGPVPAFDLGRTVPVQVYGRVVQARLLCYLNPNPRSEVDTSVSDVGAFVDSLRIDSKRLFYRYFEDVAARMHDICTHGNLRSSVMWLKEIESIVGRSITSKLQQIKPSSESSEYGRFEWRTWRQDVKLKDARDEPRRGFFRENAELVFFVNHVRCVILYLVNCVYRALGMNSRRGQYLERLADEQAHFHKFFGYDVLSRAQSLYPDLADLCGYFTGLQQQDEDLLYQECRGADWLKGVVEFIRLVYWISKTASSATRPAFFVSHHHHDKKSEDVAQLAARFVERRHEASAVLVEKDGNVGRFREKIKSSIWLSDRVVSVAVAKPVDDRTQVEKGFDWIAAESEQAILQNKGVLYLLEEGQPLEFYRDKLVASKFGLLADSWRQSPEARLKKLSKEWADSGHTFFSPKAESLDARVEARLQHECANALQRRRSLLLSAYLSFFGQVPLRLLSLVHQGLPSPTGARRSQIVLLLREAMAKNSEAERFVLSQYPNAERAVEALLTHFRTNRRALTLDKGARYYALCAEGTGAKNRNVYFYYSQLTEVLEALFPEHDVAGRQAILTACFQEALNFAPSVD